MRNGKYDPWSSGGVNDNTPGIKDGKSRGIYSFLIDGSAHHLDLRQPMTCDPITIMDLRAQVVGIMKCWIDGSSPLCPYPVRSLYPFEAKDSNGCQPLIHQYPWGDSAASGLQLSLFSLVLVMLNFV